MDLFEGLCVAVPGIGIEDLDFGMLQAVSLTLGFWVLMFLLTKPSVLLALAVILSVWEFQDRPLDISSPKYFALETTSRSP